MRAILLLSILLVGCETASPGVGQHVNTDAVDQCYALYDAFCTKLAACSDFGPNATTDADVAQCYALADKACTTNRTQLSPLAMETCELSIEQSGCDDSGFRATRGATTCINLVSSWSGL